ncbi:MAG: hypothetical protein KDD35_10970 [Bdellovibrionales bacterium]|nr:hypothetical protein [Bdellovibrionales bacterium]
MFRHTVLAMASVIAMFSAEAKIVDPADLAKVNNFIKMKLADEDSDNFQIEVTRGDLAPSTLSQVEGDMLTGGRLDFNWIEQESSAIGQGRGFLDLKMQEVADSPSSAVYGEIGFEVISSNIKEFFFSSYGYLQEVVKGINEKGFYHAELNTTESPEGSVDVSFSLVPVSPEAVSIVSIDLKAHFSEKEGEGLAIEGKALFSLGSSLIQDAQLSLTQSFNALKAEREPTVEESKGVEALFDTILEEISVSGL